MKKKKQSGLRGARTRVAKLELRVVNEERFANPPV